MKNIIINTMNAIRLNTIMDAQAFYTKVYKNYPSIHWMFKLSIVFLLSNRDFLKGTEFFFTYQGFYLIEVSLYFKTNVFGNTFF